MKLSRLKKLLSTKEAVSFDVMTNPGDPTEWVIWVRDSHGKSYLLVNEDESVLVSKDANKILSLLKDFGINSVRFDL